MELTPVENHDGLWVKREDLYRGDFGVNGAKYRACQHIIGKLKEERGAERIVSASSVLSPQAAMAAVVAREFGLGCDIIVGGTTPEKAVRHRSIEVAQLAGATIFSVAVGYNPMLQRASLEHAQDPGVERLPYGITTEAAASLEDVERFLRVGSPQTMNLPDEIETLVIPFGSGNTAAAVLYGLHDFRPAALKKVVLVGIGPDRLQWVTDRLASLPHPAPGGPGAGPLSIVPEGVELVHSQLHPWFAEYGDRMPETLDGIVLHPTYEGKVKRFLDTAEPDYWTRRDGTTALWIVGGPLP